MAIPVLLKSFIRVFSVAKERNLKERKHECVVHDSQGHVPENIGCRSLHKIPAGQPEKHSITE